MGSGGYDDAAFDQSSFMTSLGNVGDASKLAAEGSKSTQDKNQELSLSCPLLMFSTPLNSADPNVISMLKVGSMLTIQERGGIVVAVAPDGKVAGSITAPALSRLLRCMAAGYSYEGVVDNISGGTCWVTVRYRRA